MGLLDNATKPLRRAGSVGRFAADKGFGLVTQARGRFRRSDSDLNDPTIARKVETEVFRSPAVPKGKIDVNVVDGVVYLRGQAKNPAQVKAIETAARKVPEVRDVQNLLHLPKTPARSAKKQTKSTPRAKPRRVNADKTSTRAAGATPADLSKARQGREPAEMGSKDA